VRLTVRGQHACALTAEGAAFCWGSNEMGQLGSLAPGFPCPAQGSRTGVPCSSTPVRVGGELRFASISAGSSGTCGLAADGTAHCWGAGAGLAGRRYSEIALWTDAACGVTPAGATECRVAPEPAIAELTGDAKFGQVSLFFDGGCALAADGRPHCWTFPGRTPAPVEGGTRFAALSMGGRHICAISTDGTLYCWGDNSGFVRVDGPGPQQPSRVVTPVRFRAGA
jgi:hypothetical protein